jgi:hypothetical protein
MKTENRIRFLVVTIIGSALVALTIYFYLVVPFSNPFYNPLYPCLVISAIVVGIIWWIHTILNPPKKIR